jgi:hypothetical protein
MKRKPIRIDWDELETAFDNRREDLVYYLDLVTGQVVLEGEGEEGDFEDDEDLPDEDPDLEGPSREGGHRLYITPPGPEDELIWMREFMVEATDAEPELRARLGAALNYPGSAEAFREALRHAPDDRDRWFLYRTDRLHDAIEAWLDANDVRVAGPPPWRS